MDTRTTKEEAGTQFAKITKPTLNFLGFQVPDFCGQELYESLSSYPLEPTDVFISTYPKTGTTWTQQIVKLIRNKGESDGIQIGVSIPWLEAKRVNGLDIYAMPTPRAFKSHMPYEKMPCGEPRATPCKYIYVARNPKDVAVSMYFHYRRLRVLPNQELDWNLFLRNFFYGNVVFGDFFNHILSWWARRDDVNVLFLTFEDMKKDPPAAIARIAKFIGADISDEIVSKVAEKTAFQAMKRDNSVNYSWVKSNPGSTDFLRKGEVGDWVNYFTPEQSAEMDRMCSDRLKGTGLEFTFEI